MPVALEYRSDHLLIRLVGRSVLTGLRRTIVVPYSSIARVEVETPRWPSMIKEWRVGTHIPNLIAHGLFSTWKGDHRRFLHFEKTTKEVLTIHLHGHPDLHEVSIEVREPYAARDELAKRGRR